MLTNTRTRILRYVAAAPAAEGLRLLGISGSDWDNAWNAEVLLLIAQAAIRVSDDGRTGVRLFITARGSDELAEAQAAYERSINEGAMA